MPTDYVWGNATVGEAGQRFGGLSDLYDPRTTRRMEALGIREGWSCLEVGGGGGSIARWLSQKVGSTGRVVVTDIDTTFLDVLRERSNVEILSHDITKDELAPDQFDLVHARNVLLHLRQREQAIERMVSSAKPGGWIMVEDADFWALPGVLGYDFHPTKGVPPRMSTRAVEKLLDARGRVVDSHGADLAYVRRLFQLLSSHGLHDVAMEGFTTTYRGGSAGAMQEKANSLKVKDEMIASGTLSESEFEEALRLMDDPQWVRFGPLMVSAWGRK